MSEELVAERVRRVRRQRLVLLAVVVSTVTATIVLAGALYYRGMDAGMQHSMSQASSR